MVILLAVVHALKAKTAAPVAQADNDQAVKIAGKGFVRPKAVFVSGQMTSTLAAGSIRPSPLDSLY